MPRKRPKSNRKRGRPYYGRALHDRMWLAEWLDNATEEFREAGSKRPFTDAVLTYLDFASGDDERAYGAPNPKAILALLRDKKRFAAYVKLMKKKRRRGRDEVQMWYDEWNREAARPPEDQELTEEEAAAWAARCVPPKYK
jgi:hypothetical protein